MRSIPDRVSPTTKSQAEATVHSAPLSRGQRLVLRATQSQPVRRRLEEVGEIEFSHRRPEKFNVL